MIREDYDVGDPAVIIHGHVDVLIAGAVDGLAAIAVDSMTRPENAR